MFKKYALTVFAAAVAAVLGYHTPVFGHGNASTAPSPNIGRNTVLAIPDLPDQGSFVNYETPHVHPMDISPNGQWLAVANTADGYVELFFIYQSGNGVGKLQHNDSIKVGLDPVSVRWRTNNELWVVNQISDSISVVDRAAGAVERTLITYRLEDGGSFFLKGIPNGDEPADVVFSDDNTRAYVSCSRTDYIQEWDLATYSLLNEIYLDGEDPRAMDIYNDKVYTAIFESGNSTTLLFGENVDGGSQGSPPNTAVLNLNNRTDHPYYWDSAGQIGYQVNAVYPPPNDGSLGPFNINSGLGFYITRHSDVSLVDLLLSDSARYESENGVGTWDMLDDERYYFPPTTSMIVRKDFSDGDKWKDDNGGDWTEFVTGSYADETGRVSGWDMLDNDIAILDLNTDITDSANHQFATRQMNICMALAVKKSGNNTGRVYMVGIDATNEVRFEPNITGTFTRVMLSVTESDGTPVSLIDLNEAHLDAAQTAQHGVSTDAYADGSVPQSERNKSIGDPRGVAFTPDGATVYISGMGSNNVIALNTATNTRYSTGHTIEVGMGPTGVKHHATHDRLYVLNKFDASVSVIDTTTAGSESVIQTLEFHDSTPDYINTGRVHFYGTHENSGLGQLACASCHIDGRMDRLAWDLGNPDALVDESDNLHNPVDTNFTDIRGRGDGLDVGDDEPMQSLNAPGSVIMNTLVIPLLGPGSMLTEPEFEKFHPMKGPMTTQTLQDIIGKEPHHWRGDKRGIEEFAGAFDGLQGADAPLNATKMQEFEDFLSSIHFPPNPFRPLDNTLPGGPNTDGGTNRNLDMTGFYTAPPQTNFNLSASGTPMMDAVPSGGDAWNGFKVYVDDTADGSFRCVDCHTLPIGAGSIAAMPLNELPFDSGISETIPPGIAGEAHQMVVAVDGTGQPHIKVPQTRNQIDKDGFFLDQVTNVNGPPMSRAGFGVLHDGAIDGLVRFLSEPAFDDINDTTNNNGGSVGNAANDDEMVADIVAFTLAIGGADFDYLTTLSGAPTRAIPPAAEDQSAHSGVGYSVTIDSDAPSNYEESLYFSMTRRANDGDLGLIVYGTKNGERRSWVHSSGENSSTVFQSDRDGETITMNNLVALAGTGTELTFVLVEPVAQERMGLDRDQDTVYDGDELTYNTDAANDFDNVWVSDGWGGAQTGHPETPFEDFDPANAAATPSPGKGVALHFDSGSYSTSTSTFSEPMILVGESGTASINYVGP